MLVALRAFLVSWTTDKWWLNTFYSPNTPQFFRLICCNQPIIWDIFWKNLSSHVHHPCLVPYRPSWHAESCTITVSYTIRPNYKVTFSFSDMSNRGRYQFIGFLFLQKSASSERHLWFVLDQKATGSIHVFCNIAFMHPAIFNIHGFFRPFFVPVKGLKIWGFEASLQSSLNGQLIQRDSTVV